MYSVEWEEHALSHAAELPADAFPFYAELVTLLEVAPWTGDPYDRQRPDTNMRTLAFGRHGDGLLIYLILDDQRRVVILRVLWVDRPM